MSVPEPLSLGVLIHLATIVVGSGFVQRLAIENPAAFTAAGDATVAQLTWSKWPPGKYLSFLMSRKFAATLSGTSLHREGELLFALFCAQALCLLWFAVVLMR